MFYHVNCMKITWNVRGCRGDAGTGQLKLTFGMFTLYPSFGSVQPGSQQTITVDCVAESQGPCEEVRWISFIFYFW